jgi:hypothetical protein
MYSSAHSTKGTPSQWSNPHCSDRLEAHGFRIYFTPLVGVLFTIPSRYWFTIGRWSYLALGGGPPSFPPHVTCGAVLTLGDHWGAPIVAYGTLTRCGLPFQHSSADGAPIQRGLSRALHHRRSTPARQRRLASDTARVWAQPRSLAATEGILSFPRGTEMFQFPRFPLRLTRSDPPSRGPGCPIRRSLAHRRPAPPQSISSRGHVLHRHPAPRHPPCAHHSGRCGRLIPYLFPSSPRSPPGPEPSRAWSSSGRPSRKPGGPGHDQAPAVFCAGPARKRPLLFLPPAAARMVPGRRGGLVLLCCQGAGVEPRGVEPRTSAVQGRRSPS